MVPAEVLAVKALRLFDIEPLTSSVEFGLVVPTPTCAFAQKADAMIRKVHVRIFIRLDFID